MKLPLPGSMLGFMLGAAMLPANSAAPKAQPPSGAAGSIAQERANRSKLSANPTVEERNRASWDKQQPSPEALAAMSTQNLVSELVCSQLAGTMLISRTSLAPDGGLAEYAKRHRGVEELLKRPDAAEKITAAYASLPKPLVASMPAIAKPGVQTTVQYYGMVLDALIGSEELTGKMTGEQRSAAIEALLDTLDMRLGDRSSEAYPVSGVREAMSATIALEKLLELEKDATYEDWRLQWGKSHAESHAAEDCPLTLTEAAALLKRLRPKLSVPTDATEKAPLPGQTSIKEGEQTLMADSLSGAAMNMEAGFMRSPERQAASSNGDIPEQYWTPRLKLLKPLRIYIHNVNVVVAQKSENGVESGKYIYVTISSYVPMGPVDGFEFKHAGDDVYDYTRTLPGAARKP